MSDATLGLPDICLIGRMGSGKSTVAGLLQEFDYRRLAFAGTHRGGVRDVVRNIWGDDAINDRVKLIAMGQAARSVDPDAWLNSLLRVVDVNFYANVIDDGRFMNEVDGLRGIGFIVVRVTAPEDLRVPRLKANGKWAGEEQLETEIETQLDNYPADYTICNDGTKNQLYDEVVEVLLRARKRS